MKTRRLDRILAVGVILAATPVAAILCAVVAAVVIGYRVAEMGLSLAVTGWTMEVG